VRKFSTTLVKFCSSKIKLNKAYHLKIDGQINQINRFAEELLRMYIGIR